MTAVWIAAEQPGGPDIPSDPFRPDEAEGIGVLPQISREARGVSPSLPPLAQPQVECFQDLLDRDTGRRPGDVAYDAVHAVDFMLKYLAGQMSVFDGDAAALHSDTSRKRGFRLGVGTRGAGSQVLPSSSAISGRSSSALSSPPSIVNICAAIGPFALNSAGASISRKLVGGRGISRRCS